jgi:hypothetical protein
MGEVRGACNIMVGKPEGRSPLGRPRRKWEDNIKMVNVKVKLSRYTPWRHMGGEEV